MAEHYESLDRPEAAGNLKKIVVRAGERIETQKGLFFPAPRPYPGLKGRGWRWLKEGPYWIAFATDERGPVIQTIFHESADIPNRL